jgi:hypothetical protein
MNSKSFATARTSRPPRTPKRQNGGGNLRERFLPPPACLQTSTAQTLNRARAVTRHAAHGTRVIVDVGHPSPQGEPPGAQAPVSDVRVVVRALSAPAVYPARGQWRGRGRVRANLVPGLWPDIWPHQ